VGNCIFCDLFFYAIDVFSDFAEWKLKDFGQAGVIALSGNDDLLAVDVVGGQRGESDKCESGFSGDGEFHDATFAMYRDARVAMSR